MEVYGFVWTTDCKLNACTHKDAYPLLWVGELLMILRIAKFFSILDLASNYWQVPVKDQDQEKPAFITPLGLFELICMPFSLSNTPPPFNT